MPELFGKQYSPDELRRYTSTMSTLAGIRLSTLSDGKARGMRVADLHTGSGLQFQVLLDRAMDIGATTYQGTPIAWLHPALGGPDQYEPQGTGWLRTFGGGLVTTCGLTNFGQVEQDGNEHLGLHGRISHIPAGRVRVTEEWRGEDYVLELEGMSRQSVLFGENLLLTRKISTQLGATSLLIEDSVRNDGFRETPHMILYHCNFGFPVVSPDSELVIDAESTRPRDAAAEAGANDQTRFEAPVPGYPEQVFFIKPRVDAEGYSQATIHNPSIGFGAYVRYRAAELPYFAQWKMMGAGEYVCALEPANQWETPRRVLREEGRLKMLAPGEEVNYRLEIGVTSNE